MLAKKEADLNERLAAVSSAPVQTTTVKTVAESKPDQPVINETPFGEEDQKTKGSKQAKSTWRGIAKQVTEALTFGVPKRPSVFDGGGNQAVFDGGNQAAAFPPTTDVVTVKETSDIPERLEAELREKNRALEVLGKELEELKIEKDALEAELTEKDRRLKELNTSNKDLRRKLVETGEKLSKAEEESENLGVVLNAEYGVQEEMQEKMALMKKRMQWMDLLKFPDGRDMCFLVSTIEVPNEEDRSVLNLAMKSEEVLRFLKEGYLKVTSISMNALQERAIIKPVALCYRFRDFPEPVMVCTVFNEEHGSILSCCYRRKPKHRLTSDKHKLLNDASSFASENDLNASLWQEPGAEIVASTGKVSGNSNKTSTEGLSKGLYWICPRKKKANKIRKLKHEEVAVDVVPEKNWQDPKPLKLYDVFSAEENKTFKVKENEIRTNGRRPLADKAFEPNKDDAGLFANKNFRKIRASIENDPYKSPWKDDTEIVAPTDEASGNSNETSTKGFFWGTLEWVCSLWH